MADVDATFVQMLLDIPERNGGWVARFGQSEFGQFQLVTPPYSLIFFAVWAGHTSARSGSREIIRTCLGRDRYCMTGWSQSLEKKGPSKKIGEDFET